MNGAGYSKTERGVALVEFLVSAPFLVIMLTAMIDVGLMLNQYLTLSTVAHAGARVATQYPMLETGAHTGLSPGQACQAGLPTSSHIRLQQRLVDLVNLNSQWVKPSTLCIKTEVRRGGTWNGTAQDQTVYIRISANYDAFFPLFDGREIAVESNGPLLAGS